VARSRVRAVIVVVRTKIVPPQIVHAMKVRAPERAAWEVVDLAGALAVEASAVEDLAPAVDSEAHAAADSARPAAARWDPCRGADLECRRAAPMALAQAPIISISGSTSSNKSSM